MRPPGSFKLIGYHGGRRGRTAGDSASFDPYPPGMGREMRIVESLRNQILEGGDEQALRIRRVLDGPREIYRIEIEVPRLRYQRTTLLDGDALEELLAYKEVRDLIDAGLQQPVEEPFRDTRLVRPPLVKRVRFRCESSNDVRRTNRRPAGDAIV